MSLTQVYHLVPYATLLTTTDGSLEMSEDYKPIEGISEKIKDYGIPKICTILLGITLFIWIVFLVSLIL